MRWSILTVIASLFFGGFARAEYRAYQLVIVSGLTGDEKRILSTFDNIQYRGFYSLGPGDEIFIENSWMCWENTSYHKPICPPPKIVPATGQKTNSRSIVQTP
jgi:hypothetical protein